MVIKDLDDGKGIDWGVRIYQDKNDTIKHKWQPNNYLFINYSDRTIERHFENVTENNVDWAERNNIPSTLDLPNSTMIIRISHEQDNKALIFSQLVKKYKISKFIFNVDHRSFSLSNFTFVGDKYNAYYIYKFPRNFTM